MCKNVAQPEATDNNYDAHAFHAGYPRIQTHTFSICNNYCFSTATTVAQIPLNIMLYVLFKILGDVLQRYSLRHSDFEFRQLLPDK